MIGAEKFDTNKSLYPSFLGWITEIRISSSLRYTGPYPTPSARFPTDGSTVGLYHFGTGYGDPIYDSSGASAGPSNGLREYGGVVNGPEWTYDSPWYMPPAHADRRSFSDTLPPVFALDQSRRRRYRFFRRRRFYSHRLTGLSRRSGGHAYPWPCPRSLSRHAERQPPAVGSPGLSGQPHGDEPQADWHECGTLVP